MKCRKKNIFKILSKHFHGKNQFARQNENFSQNRLCIFGCNERKNIFDISISKRIQKSLKLKIQRQNIYYKQIMEIIDCNYNLNEGSSFTIFEFEFGMDCAENCSSRGRRSLTKANNWGTVQSQWGKKIESCLLSICCIKCFTWNIFIFLRCMI